MEAINKARVFEYVAYMRSAHTIGERAYWAGIVDSVTTERCPWAAEAFLISHQPAMNWLNANSI